MSKYICQLRHGWKDDAEGRNDWATYEATKYVSTKSYNPTSTYYLDELGTVANPQPTKSQVENGSYYIKNPNYVQPLAGELVLEYDNGIPRLKIGDGTSDFSSLPYMSVDSFVLPTQALVHLSTNWELDTDNRYYQVVTVQNAIITPNSKVDLQIRPEDLTTFHEKDLAFVAENDNGNVTVYCIGQQPKNPYTLYATVTEVVSNG